MQNRYWELKLVWLWFLKSGAHIFYSWFHLYNNISDILPDLFSSNSFLFIPRTLFFPRMGRMKWLSEQKTYCQTEKSYCQKEICPYFVVLQAPKHCTCCTGILFGFWGKIHELTATFCQPDHDGDTSSELQLPPSQLMGKFTSRRGHVITG